MVIDNFLKVNTSSDPKVEELRQRLAALQQKAVPPAQTTQVIQQGVQTQPSQTPTAQPQPSTSNQPQERPLDRNVSAMQNPEFKLREERTMNLITNQIKELITLHTDASKRIKEFENKQNSIEKDLESFKDKHEELLQKMNTIDSRLEKFMGLYELVTNQYNPFADSKSPTIQSLQRQAQSVPLLPTPKQHETVVKIEDNITHQSIAVPLSKQDQEKAIHNFKKVEEMLADLQKQHEDKQPLPTSTPQPLSSELHSALHGFEERLQHYIDKTLQDKLHHGFTELEKNLQAEVRDALKDELANIQQDDRGVQEALNELQELLQSSESNNRIPVEEQLSELTAEIAKLQDGVKTLPPNLYFRVADGTILKSIQDLKLTLQLITPEVFSRHFGAGRNDFADWVEHALQLPGLANNLRSCQDKAEMLHILNPGT